jgi:hypothetical protein
MKLATFQSVGKAYVDTALDLPWADVVKLLTTHFPAKTKEDVPLFNLAEFKQVGDEFCEPGRKYHGKIVDGKFERDASGTYDEIPNTVRRCKGNVLSISGIVLDVDEALSIDQAIEMLNGIEFVLYTTFRHKHEKQKTGEFPEKFRIVIPFARPLMAEDVSGRQQSITETFPGVDSASFTVSQSFYFHSGNREPRVYHGRGEMIDPYRDFEYREPEVYRGADRENKISMPLSGEAAEQYANAVRASLRSCSGLHYAGTNSNLAVLTLVSICRSIGMQFEEFDAICASIAHPDSQLVNPSVRRSAWTGWHGDRIRGINRDKFIEAYGGTSVYENMRQIKRELPDPLAGMRTLSRKEFIKQLKAQYENQR